MPLDPGKSRAAFSSNVREMVNAGHPVKQAVAAAYREAGERRDAVSLDCAKLDAVLEKADAFDLKMAHEYAADLIRQDEHLGFNGLVKKLEGKGYSSEYATKIAGKVANEKSK